MRRRNGGQPSEMAGKQAQATDLPADRREREAHTCWHCRTTYTTAADATRCERIHEDNT